MRLFALIGALALVAACGKSTPAPQAPDTATPAPSASADAAPATPEGDADEPAAAADTEAPAPEPDAGTAKVDCVPEVVADGDNKPQVRIGDTPVAIPAPEFGEATVFHLPWQGKLLVGVSASTIVHMGYEPGGALWQVDCADLAAAPVKFYAEEGADFGVAITTADGEGVYYSRHDGLGRLDLASKKAELVLPGQPVDRDCAEMRGPQEGTWLQRVFPEELTDAGPIVRMGAPCGYEGDWELRRYLVTAIDDAETRQLTRLPAISALTAGPDGTVWLGGAGCDSFMILDPSTDGAVWRSKDGGVSWAPVPIAAPYEAGAEPRPLDGAVADIIVDAKDGQHVVVRSPICDSSAAAMGGDVMVTRDGGATWVRVADPYEPDIDGGQGIRFLWSPDGDADHLYAADRRGGDETGAPKVAETKDGGKTWTAVEDVKVPARGDLKAVTVNGASLEPDVTGVTRVAEEGAREASFPPPNWFVETTFGRALPTRAKRVAVGWEDVAKALEANKRGVGLLKKKQADEAIAAFDEALKADPNFDLARYNRACAHGVAGRADEAMKGIEELSARGGYQALMALKAAPADKDLEALWGRPEFRRLTTVGVLEPAYIDSDYGEHHWLAVKFASDPFERMCVWTNGDWSDGDEPLPPVVDQVDCATGLSVGKRSGTAKDLDAIDGWLQGLGMVAWTPVEDEGTVKRAAAYLKSQRPELAETAEDEIAENLKVFQSPSGPAGRVAMVMRAEPEVRLIALASALKPSDGSP